jgi:hypothetical protein
MNAVRGDHDICFHDRTIRERQPGRIPCVIETDAAMSGVQVFARKGIGQDLNEVRAVHPERRVPA